MDLIKSIVNYWSKRKNNEDVKAPEGVCPPCWGTQEYDNVVRELYKDQQIDVNNHNSSTNYAFIQDFVVNHVDGIKLKKGKNSFECPTCKTKIPA